MYKYILYIYLLATTTSTTAADCTGCHEFCEVADGYILWNSNSNRILITSPNYPDLEHSTESNCNIIVNNLQLLEQEAVAHIQQQSIVSNETSECLPGFTITYIDQSLSLEKWTTTQRDGELCTVSTDIILQQASLNFSLLSTGTNPAFNATFTLIPLRTMRSNDNDKSKTSVSSTPTAYLQTHDAFNFEHGSYNSDIDKRLYLLNILESAVLTLQFVYLNIGDRSSCGSDLNGDVLVIYPQSNISYTPLYICSDVNSTIPTQEIYLPSGTHSLLFNFISNADDFQGNGFLLKYSVTVTFTPETTTMASDTTSVASSRQQTSTTEREISGSPKTEKQKVVNGKEVLWTGVGAGVGALVMICIIMALIYVRTKIRRRSHDPEVNTESFRSDGPLTPTDEKSQKVGQENKIIHTGSEPILDCYESVDISPPAMSNSTTYSEPDEVVQGSVVTELPLENVESTGDPNKAAGSQTYLNMARTADADKSQTTEVEQTYAAICPSTKKAQVEMIENTLYASHDSL